MIYLRVCGTQYVLNNFDLKLVANTCLSITLKFYCIDLNDNFYFAIGLQDYPVHQIQNCNAWILSHFPEGSHLYLDQYLPVTRDELEQPQSEPVEVLETINDFFTLTPMGWRRHEMKVCYEEDFRLDGLPNFFTECKACKRMAENSTDFTLFCSDSCQEKANSYFNFEY